jgi:hypothetical protein
MNSQTDTRRSLAATLLTREIVKVGFTVNKRYYDPSESLGRLHADDKVKIIVQVGRKDNLAPIVAFGSENFKANTLAMRVLTASESRHCLEYGWNVPLIENDNRGYPKAPQNRIYLLTKSPNGGYSLFMVGVLSQDLESWGWVEQVDSGRITFKKGDVRVHGSSDFWSSIVKSILESSNSQQEVRYPAEAKPAPSTPLSAGKLKAGTGRVAFFNPFANIGLVHFKADDGNVLCVKVYFANIKGANKYGLRMLEAGSLVTGTLKESIYKKGPLTGKPYAELTDVVLLPY